LDSVIVSEQTFASFTPGLPVSRTESARVLDRHVGATSSTEYVADESRLADKYGNPGVKVLASPHLVELAEIECLRCVTDLLEPGWSTVGIRLDVRHLAPTPEGMTFTMHAVLRQADRRRLVFDVEARDEVELVFAGTHERVMVETASFLAKAAAKRRPKRDPR
jgi:fluoroacetyl-CoA thioesterase